MNLYVATESDPVTIEIHLIAFKKPSTVDYIATPSYYLVYHGMYSVFSNFRNIKIQDSMEDCEIFQYEYLF